MSVFGVGSIVNGCLVMYSVCAVGTVYFASKVIKVVKERKSALRHGSHSFTCKLHHACLSFITVHQMAPSLNVVANI